MIVRFSWNVIEFGVKEYQSTRWGVGGEAGNQVSVSVSYCCETNLAKWSGLNNEYF